MSVKVSIDPWAAVAGAFYLLVMPVTWLGAAAIAATVHEGCHLLATHLTGGWVVGITIGVTGAKLSVRFPDQKGELVTALAGPAGSFLLLGFLPIAPEIALCGQVQGLFNLLPLYPMDGGRVLRCLLEWRSPDRVEILCRRVEVGTLLAISIPAILASLWLHLGIWPVVLVDSLVLRWLYQKNSLQIM